MSTEDKSKLLRFPCSYPLKVMGRNTEEFRSAVEEILGKHVPCDKEVIFSRHVSSGDRYLSITATFVIESEEQLVALYKELHEHELVLMTL
jgi:uncharacterized protein